MLRCFIENAEFVESAYLTLSAKESHHLIKVRRLQIGSELEVLNGQGWVAIATLTELVRQQALVQIKQVTLHKQKTPRVCLLQALSKGKSFDLILRAATELGVAEIWPVFTEHSEVHLNKERAITKLVHWQVIVIESCKQSGNSWLPIIHPPQILLKCLDDGVGELEQGKHIGLLADLSPDALPITEILRRNASVDTYCYAVGPEGDFSQTELNAMKQHGFQSVNLGPYVLRSETAAIVGLSALGG